MDSEGNFPRLCEHRFWSNQKICNFNEKLSPTPYLFFSTCSGIDIELSVQSHSILQENKDYIVIRIKEYHGSERNSVLPSLTCIISILDTDGNKKFPRTFEFQCLSKTSETSSTHLKYSDLFVEERYIRRSSILDNASEYLQQNTYEGTLREWIPPAAPLFFNDLVLNRIPRSLNRSNFNIKQCAEGIKISLPENSKYIRYLIENSDFFREMCDILIKRHCSEQESVDDDIPLKTEELPAFLCMLIFIETRQLFLYKVTISDLYKIADKYIIPTLLKACRSIIIKMLSKNTASNIFTFAQFYYDKELEEAARSYLENGSHETLENNQNFKMTNDFDDSFDTNPVYNSAIKTETDFFNYLQHVEKELRSTYESAFSKAAPELLEIHLFNLQPDPEILDFHV